MSTQRLENHILEPDLKRALPQPPWLQIRPTFPMLGNDPQDLFLSAIQRLVDSIVPDDFWLEPSLTSEACELEINEEAYLKNSSCFYRLMKSLPLFQYSSLSENSISVTYLCPAEYTEGVGRYVVDTLSRWLIPGKLLSISGAMSLNFQFIRCPNLKFYIGTELIGVQSNDDLEMIRASLPSLIQEMKINIMAVHHARHIASLRSVSLEQKNKIIQENLASILNLPSQEIERSLYDQMQGFLLKLSSEEKIVQVKKNIAHLRHSRPKAFDRNVFYEMTHFTVLFHNQFSSKRQPRHISRVIALHYLFKKALHQSIEKAPQKRHLSIKVFNTSLESSEHVLGILLGMNLLRDSERFERRQLLDAIRSCLPETLYVADSFIADQRDDKVRFVYLEIQKSHARMFSKEEIKTLRLKLPEAIKGQIANTVHPIFMPRNEEELLRNLIILCKQLKYVRDLPQVSIHYEKQTDTELSFTVLLARLLVRNEPPLKDLFYNVDSPLRFGIDEVRVMSNLKRKYPKEGAIIRATLNKSPFFRQDHSVDLLRARQKVVLELNRVIGEFRDYNGGMILKQDESLDLLRKSLENPTLDQEFLLENYFYSLRPGIMQTVHESSVLKTHFLLLIDLVAEELSKSVYKMKTAIEGKFYLYFMGALAPSFKEVVGAEIEKLKIPSYDLTSTFLQIHDLSTLGYILRTEDPATAALFESVLLTALQNWSDQFFCPVKRKG